MAFDLNKLKDEIRESKKRVTEPKVLTEENKKLLEESVNKEITTLIERVIDQIKHSEYFEDKLQVGLTNLIRSNEGSDTLRLPLKLRFSTLSRRFDCTFNCIDLLLEEKELIETENGYESNPSLSCYDWRTAFINTIGKKETEWTSQIMDSLTEKFEELGLKAQKFINEGFTPFAIGDNSADSVDIIRYEIGSIKIII